jgi:hypothetical protein
LLPFDQAKRIIIHPKKKTPLPTQETPLPIIKSSYLTKGIPGTKEETPVTSA